MKWFVLLKDVTGQSFSFNTYTTGSSGSMHVMFTGHTEEAERPGSIAEERTQQQGRRQYLDILLTVLLP